MNQLFIAMIATLYSYCSLSMGLSFSGVKDMIKQNVNRFNPFKRIESSSTTIIDKDTELKNGIAKFYDEVC